MLDALALVYHVIRRPNSAFATLRDDDRRYFPPSVVVMLLASIAYAGSIDSSISAASGFWVTALGTIAYAGTIYLIGRAFGGNKSWRKVLTVVFYVDIIWIPLTAGLFLSSLTSPGLQIVGGILVIVFFIWVIIVEIKAVKVLNGFGTAKAIGILILSWVIQLFWLVPIFLLYLWTIPFELPILQTPLQ